MNPLNLKTLLRASIADTQFEVARAQTRLQRWRAMVRGYAAVCRLLFVTPLFVGETVGRLLATLLLGSVGSGLLAVSLTQQNGPVQIAPFFLLGIITPLVLRVLKLGHSYWQMFIGCATVVTIMAVTSYLWIATLRSGGPSIPPIRNLVIGFALVSFGSALAASLAWPSFDQGSLLGQIVSALKVGWAAYALAWFASGLLLVRPAGFEFWWRHDLLLHVSLSAVEAFYYVALSTLLIVPLLLLLRRIVPGRTSIAVLGALFFPLPLFAHAVMLYGFRGVSVAWSRITSIDWAMSTLTAIISAAALGWCLGTLGPDPEIHEGHLSR